MVVLQVSGFIIGPRCRCSAMPTNGAAALEKISAKRPYAICQRCYATHQHQTTTCSRVTMIRRWPLKEEICLRLLRAKIAAAGDVAISWIMANVSSLLTPLNSRFKSFLICRPSAAPIPKPFVRSLCRRCCKAGGIAEHHGFTAIQQHARRVMRSVSLS